MHAAAHDVATVREYGIVDAHWSHGAVVAFDESMTVVGIHVLGCVVADVVPIADGELTVRSVVHQVFNVAQVLGGLGRNLRRERRQRSCLGEAITIRGVERLDDDVFESVERDVELGGNPADCFRVGHVSTPFASHIASTDS